MVISDFRALCSSVKDCGIKVEEVDLDYSEEFSCSKEFESQNYLSLNSRSTGDQFKSQDFSRS